MSSSSLCMPPHRPCSEQSAAAPSPPSAGYLSRGGGGEGTERGVTQVAGEGRAEERGEKREGKGREGRREEGEGRREEGGGRREERGEERGKEGGGRREEGGERRGERKGGRRVVT